MENRPPFALVRLKQFKTAPQSKYLLRLLAALNELDSLSVLIKALDANKIDDTDFLRYKRRDGVSLYLLRQQSAIVYSVLFDCVWTINQKVEEFGKQKVTAKTPASLWNLIIGSEKLSSQLDELNSLFEKSAKNFGYVRDRLASHIDLSAVSTGLTQLSEKHDFGILYADRDWREFRALFVDDVLSESWKKDAFKLELGEEPTGEQITEHAEMISLLKGETAEFAHTLFMECCLKFDLFGNEDERAEVSQELDEFKKKHASGASAHNS